MSGPGPGQQEPYYSPYSTPYPPTAPQYPQQYQRPPVNYRPAEAGWWLGSDGLWYPPETRPYDPYAGYYSDKSKIVAGILQLAVSGLGIGRFYLGYTGIGVAQLLVTIFTCGFGAIWCLIDGIVILCGGVKTDGDGRPLR